MYGISSRGQQTVGGPPTHGLGLKQKNPHRKKSLLKMSQSSSNLDKRPKVRKMDMRFGTWNVRRLYREGLFMTVAKEILKLYLVGVQFRWDRSGMEPAGEHRFFCRMENENHELGTCFFVHKRIISAVKRVEFVSDRLSYIRLRGCWYDVIVLNVHAPKEDKIDDMKDRFYKKTRKCIR
jgi:hypothetical protein